MSISTEQYDAMPEAHKRIADLVQMCSFYVNNPKDFPIDGNMDFMQGKLEAYEDVMSTLYPEETV